MTSRRPRRTGPRPVFASVWPEDEEGLPPLDGVVPALATFDGIADASRLEIELAASRFFAMLGAGSPEPLDPGEPGHEELINGLVEVCLHHLDQEPPRVVVDFCWVVDAVDPGYVQWPLAERLAESDLPAKPAWLHGVGEAEVEETLLVEHEMGDGFDVVLLARHPGAEQRHVVAAYVDRTIGGLARDLLVHPDADEFLARADDESGMTVRSIDPATAAATVDEAIDHVFELEGAAPVAPEFAALFSLVDHYVAKLPPGGTPLPAPVPATSAQQLDAVERFLSSPAGAAHAEDRDVLVAATGFVVDELGGDPLRWTPMVVQIVLAGWLPVSGFDDNRVARFPDLVRSLVPWAHAEQGWADRYVTETLAIVDAVEAGEDDESIGAEILERAVAEGVDLDDPEALDAFLDRYLDE